MKHVTSFTIAAVCAVSMLWTNVQPVQAQEATVPVASATPAPLGKGLQVDVGKFVTQHGAEVIEAKSNWNYSRSLLFSLAIPYYHSGVRVSYALNGKTTIMGTIVNGWNNVVENNSGKTLGAQ